MSAINSLLGLDPSIERPNAYQIFGLEVLESDSQRISNSIRAVSDRLQASRETADPKVWGAAAKSVNKAKEILSDPVQKKKYDTRLSSTFESVAVAPPAQPRSASESKQAAPRPAATPPPIDLLAGLLPSADPFASFDMAVALAEMPVEEDNADIADDLIPQPETPFGSDVTTSLPVPTPASAGSAMGTPQIGMPSKAAFKEPRKRRKKGFPVGGVILTLFVVGLFGAIGYAVKLLMDREQQQIAEVNRLKESIPEEPSTQVVLKEPKDNVMGNLLPPGSPKQRSKSKIKMGVKPKVDSMINRDRDNEEFTRMVPSAMDNMNSMNDSATSMESMEPTEKPAVKPDGVFNTGQLSAEMEKTEIVMMDEPPASDAMIKAGEAAAEKARAAIKALEWDKMVTLSEQAIEAAANDEQAAEAASRRRLVHYASEYQAAIDRQIGQFDGGESITLNEALVVGVVEVSQTQLILKVRGQNKVYERAALPQIIAHALGNLGLGAGPTVQLAFRGAWDCLHPKATQDHRDQVYLQWNTIAGESPDANIDGLQEEVEKIFAGS